LKTLIYRMYYGLQHYFMNGGGACYVVSVGDYTTPATDGITAGLNALDAQDEPTLYIFPDQQSAADYNTTISTAVARAFALGDRIVLADVDQVEMDGWASSASTPLTLRSVGIIGKASYCAAYAPYLETSLVPVVKDADIQTAAGNDNALYNSIKVAIAKLRITLPPSPAVAAAYVVNDATRGVAHAPANLPIIGGNPVLGFTQDQLGRLNVDSNNGRSINVIRNLIGRGTHIYGARTMDGNSNEWRYVSVRRFFNMVEESVKKATEAYVFEPNNATTWQNVKTMVGNYLNLQWRDGALQGAKPSEAYYVKVGLGETMDSNDVLAGLMRVQIGMSVNRPAEFIVLQFSHFMAGNA
jgi:phage tail sheath protein FI